MFDFDLSYGGSADGKKHWFYCANPKSTMGTGDDHIPTGKPHFPLECTADGELTVKDGNNGYPICESGTLLVYD